MTTRTRKGKDVAWGFFITEFIHPRASQRQLIAFPKRSQARDALTNWSRFEPGPIFRITEPAKPRSRSHD
jgi:hypothetical protein